MRMMGGALIDKIRLIQAKDELDEEDLVVPTMEQYEEAERLIKALIKRGEDDGDLDLIDKAVELKNLLEDDETTSYHLSKYINQAKDMLREGNMFPRSYAFDEFDEPDDFKPMEGRGYSGRGFINPALTRNKRGRILIGGAFVNKPLLIRYLKQIAGGFWTEGVTDNNKEYRYFTPRYNDAKLQKIADDIIDDYKDIYNDWGDNWITRNNVERLYTRYQRDY